MKYVVILLRADNHGEGGTLAMTALAHRAPGRGAPVIIMLGIISGALFYGDATITPALSVLSAIEGVKVGTPAFDPSGTADRADPIGLVPGAIVRQGQGRGLLRSDHAGVVHGPRHRVRPRSAVMLIQYKLRVIVLLPCQADRRILDWLGIGLKR
jgi:hypothetical protein